MNSPLNRNVNRMDITFPVGYPGRGENRRKLPMVGTSAIWGPEQIERIRVKPATPENRVR
jgi:hypothetical protein